MSPGHRSPGALVGALLAVSALSAGCERAVEEPAPRNLLLISVDTLRADQLGAYGADFGISPNIDALARDAVVFENAVSQSSWTLPAFASLMTSTWPSTHGVDEFKDALAPSFVTLGEVLSEAGFDTAAVTSHAFVGPRYGMDQGIAAFDDSLVSGSKQAELRVSSPGVTSRGLAWLRDAAPRERRWFLWLHYFDPHYPYIRHDEPGEPVGETAEDYRGDIAFTDRWIGEVLAEVERSGLADETLVMLVSDHGEEFRERKKLRHGYTLFHEVVRVPFIARAPGVEPRRVAAAVGGVDFMPTVLDLLDVPAPDALVGRSLVSAMVGGELDEIPILSELRLNPKYHADSLRMGEWTLVLDHGGRATLGFAEHPGGPPVDDSTKPNAPAGPLDERVLLYHVHRDPLERRDVAAAHPEVVKRMRATLEALQLRARAAGGDEARAVEHTPDELDVLRQLGYVGDEEHPGD